MNTTLTEIDLSLNYIDDKGGKAIADALDANKTCAHPRLYLSQCPCARAGLLADACGHSRLCACSLKVLNMSGNEIEDKDLRKKCRSRK